MPYGVLFKKEKKWMLGIILTHNSNDDEGSNRASTLVYYNIQ
jgi:hypothetical protein